ncbi:uncharacterized protein LOC100574043 [Acyrthosiphon pisum]|uniref:Uncharacterized protein n=1 Tax=Acyrthosiphon pisum TaxID=7029 RepID=A0A8R2A875_ACYPI|nr:uncharacterized protein LOC100574043 [Acyrthosiphon pisum]|eukprot:XP_003245528.1 PREDICTED: uncharacterized protein LOC100574043 [Acyrthosiphon pisum]
MACKIKEDKNMAPSALLRAEDDSSEDDNQRKRDKNNRVVERVSSRTRAQRKLRRLNKLNAEKAILVEKQKVLLKELRFWKTILIANGISLIASSYFNPPN